MDITTGIICMQLQQYYKIETNFPMEHEINIKGFQIWNGECPETGILYICREEPPDQKDWDKKIYVDICGIKHVRKNSKSFFLSVTENITFDQLINTLQSIFFKFYQWCMMTEQSFYKQENISAILNKLEQQYSLISLLVDKNLKYIAMSDGYARYHSYVGHSHSMPLDIANQLILDDNFQNALWHNKPFIYQHGTKNGYSYCYNIRINGQYEARFLVENKDFEKYYGGFSFAGYIGKHLEEILNNRNDEKLQEAFSYDFYNLLKCLCEGESKSNDEIRQHLQIRHWQKNDTYQVYVFQFINQESKSFTRRYYQTEMEQLFRECCILVDGEYLCCIRNLSISDSKTQDIHQELAVFLRENMCKAGISQCFTDISQLQQYYLEAEKALQIGLDSKSFWWYYPFDALILPYICHQVSKEISIRQLYHPAVHTLLQYDEKEGTELVKSAYFYMKYRYNVTQTAQKLFIHRTTMLFRLQRIDILTNIDWDSWTDRLHMALTFEFMKKNGELAALL